MIDSTNIQTAKTVVPSCPLRSTAISWMVKGKDSKEQRMHDQAIAPCVRGNCCWWVPVKQKCAVMVLVDGMGKS